MQMLIPNILRVCLYLISLLTIACSSHQDVAKSITKAQQFEQDHKYQSAIIELKNALQVDPNNKQARLLLGSIYVIVGDGVSAEKELGKAISLGIDKEQILTDYITALIQQNKNDEALQQIAINDAWSADKKSTILVLKGKAYLNKGESKKAEAAFRDANTLNPNNSRSNIGLATLALISGNPEQASQIISAIPDNDENIIDVLVLRAKIARSQLQLDNAEKYFTQALDISQRLNRINQSLNIQSQLSMVLISENKIDSALENVNHLLKAAPNYVIAVYLRGLIAYMQKDYDMSLEYLQRVNVAIPQHLPSMLLLGAINYVKGNYEQANTYLTTFVNQVPSHIHARKLLGMVRLHLHKPEEALQVLKSGTEANMKQDAQLLAIIGQAASVGGDTSMGIEYLQRAKKIQPESSEIRAELAKVYLSQGAYDKAIQELESVASENNVASKANRLLIYTYIRKGDFDHARASAKEMIDAAPDNPAGWLVKGGVEMIAGNRGEARKDFSKALSLQPDFIPARLNLARIEFEDGNMGEASNNYDAILAKDAKNEYALLGLAQIAEKNGDSKKAIEWLEKARQVNDKAIEPRLVLGRYYFSMGQYQQSLAVAKEAAAIDKNNTAILRLIASSLIKLDRAQEALNTYQQVIDNDPKNPQWHYELANIYRGFKQLSQARQSLNRALTLDKAYLPASINLAGIDMQQGKLDDALKRAEQIKKQHPKSAAAYIIMGDVYVQKKDLQRAQKIYIDGFKVEPLQILVNKIFLLSGALNNYETSINITNQWLNKFPDDVQSRMYLGLAYQGLNQNDKAEQVFQAVLAMQPNNVMALNNLAYLLIRGDNQRAMQYAEKANQLAPDNFAIMDTYGWVLTQGGNVQRGVEVLQQAHAKSHDNPSVGYHYAYALAKANERPKAATLLQGIIQSGKPFPEQVEAEQLLNTLR